MKRWVADVTDCTLTLLCHLTGHAFGCLFMLRPPFRWLHEWACAVRYEGNKVTPCEAYCPSCGKHDAVVADELERLRLVEQTWALHAAGSDPRPQWTMTYTGWGA